MKFFGTKRGSLSIYLAVFFVCIISAATVFIEHTKEAALESSVKSLGSLWLQAELGKYDRNLFEEYGLYGFWGDSETIKKDIDLMAKYSFKGKKYAKYRGCDINFSSNSLDNPEVLKKQISKVAVGEKFKSLIVSKGEEGSKEHNTFEKSENKITNQAILNDLPSKGYDSSVSVDGLVSKLSGKKSIADVLKYAGEEYLIDQYIKGNFNSYGRESMSEDKVLSNEVEYIISGKKEDEKNRYSIKLKILAIRQILNTATIYSNPEMYAKVKAASVAISPGPQAAVVEILLIQGWALAESENDYELLIRGKKVPLRKDQSTWAVDIESIVKNKETGFIDMNNAYGECYDDYLSLFLYIMDDHVKLLRIMDLIQLNMKLKYYNDFLMKEYYTGISLNIKVNNDEVFVKKDYY